METENKPPLLLELLFGEAAQAARQGASERLLRWCAAFDEWLAELRRSDRRGAAGQALNAWRQLMQQGRKPPWELSHEDLEQHAAWMLAQGYAAGTIRNYMADIANFYRWCSARRVDEACPPDFNPAVGVRRAKVKPFDGAELLSREEVGALLGIMGRDQTPLGRREYAFVMVRLRLGAPMRALQRLEWGQIEQDEAGAWVRWRPEAGRIRLPEDAWEAIRAYLEDAGRLEGMRPGMYIFTPLVEPLGAHPGRQASDWDAGRYLSNSQLLNSLKLYGRRVGIADGKLTLQALRRTAIRMHLEAGDGVAEMKSYLGVQEPPNSLRYRLRRLPALPPEHDTSQRRGDSTPHPPRRGRFGPKPGQGMTDGLHDRGLPLPGGDKPPQGVLEVLAEDVHGIDEEIAGLRTLGRGLLERQGTAHSREAVRLGDAYFQTATRLAEMIKAEAQFTGDSKEDAWSEEVLAVMDKFQLQAGLPPVSAEIRAAVLGGDPELEAADRRVVEEIAATRYVLRNAFSLAMQAQEAQDYIRLVEVYGSGCVRLVRLLKMEKGGQSRLKDFLNEQLDRAIREVVKEFGLENFWEDTRDL